MLAAIIAIIAVGVGCFVGMRFTFLNLQAAQTSYYSRCRMADFWVSVKKAPIGEVQRLTELPGVSEVRSRIVYPVVVDLAGVERPLGGLALSLPTHPAPIINNIVLQRGSYFFSNPAQRSHHLGKIRSGQAYCFGKRHPSHS